MSVERRRSGKRAGGGRRYPDFTVGLLLAGGVTRKSPKAARRTATDPDGRAQQIRLNRAARAGELYLHGWRVRPR